LRRGMRAIRTRTPQRGRAHVPAAFDSGRGKPWPVVFGGAAAGRHGARTPRAWCAGRPGRRRSRVSSSGSWWRWPCGSCRLRLALDSMVNGAVFALWPVMWIVFNALVLYNIAVRSGRFDAFRKLAAAAPAQRPARGAGCHRLLLRLPLGGHLGIWHAGRHHRLAFDPDRAIRRSRRSSSCSSSIRLRSPSARSACRLPCWERSRTCPPRRWRQWSDGNCPSWRSFCPSTSSLCMAACARCAHCGRCCSWPAAALASASFWRPTILTTR
jgi:hypothetical protein